MLLVPIVTLMLLAGSCGIGAWIGSTKHRTIMGAVLGVFGIVGRLIVALVPGRANDLTNTPTGTAAASVSRGTVSPRG